jgi:rod shape determining protein RodA
MTGRSHPLKVLRHLDWWLVLVSLTLVLVGLVFIHSATRYDPMFVGQHNRQALFVLVSAGLGGVLVLIPYPRIMRFAWLVYAAALVALLLIPIFGTTINGARRWFMLPGFAIQPAEFAKLAVIFALAAWLRFRSEGRLFDNVVMPLVIAGVPAVLVMQQPDLGSAMVFCPIAVVMAYSAGASVRHLLWTGLLGLVVVVLAYAFVLQDYQLERIDAWQGHFTWQPETTVGAEREEIRNLIRGPGSL